MTDTQALVDPCTAQPSINPCGPLPVLIAEAGTGAGFAWDEFFNANNRNPHTRTAYRWAVIAGGNFRLLHGLLQQIGRILKIKAELHHPSRSRGRTRKPGDRHRVDAKKSFN